MQTRWQGWQPALSDQRVVRPRSDSFCDVLSAHIDDEMQVKMAMGVDTFCPFGTKATAARTKRIKNATKRAKSAIASESAKPKMA
jgi:hypothetical protein